MDVQVLNEIANPVRQTSLTQVRASVSSNAQLKGLKGNPVSVPGGPVPPSSEDLPEQTQGPVTPEISPVARAASAYSAAVGDGLNSDELNAIQDLAGKVRAAVSDFLNQPGLEQAENAAAVVASNPEAVQELTSRVEQVVVETLNLPEPGNEVIVNAIPLNEDTLEEIPASQNFISVERVTNGGQPNNSVQVADAIPASLNPRAGENISVENPAPVEEGSSRGDFRVAAATPTVQNPQVSENIQVETPVSRPETVTTTNSQEVAVTAPRPEVQNVRAGQNFQEEVPVAAASSIVQNTQAGGTAPVETPVSRPETVTTTNSQEVAVTAPRPEVQNVRAGQKFQEEVPVAAASSIVQNTQAGGTAPVETPVSNPEAVAIPPQGSVSRAESITANQQEVPVAVTSPAVANATVQNAGAGNPVTIPVSTTGQGQGLEQTQTANPEGIITLPEGASGQVVSGQSDSQAAPNPQPASGPQSRTVQPNDLFAQENAAVNPENIRNANELVNSVVDSEFTSEAKKIFSEPKVIRTVADLADFILERLREIIIAKQQQSQSGGGIGIS